MSMPHGSPATCADTKMSAIRCSVCDWWGPASGWDRVEADGHTQGVGLLDDLAHGALGVAAGEVVGAQVVVGDLVGQDVPDRDGEFVHDGAQGSLPAAAGGEAPVVDGVVGVL